MKTQNQEVSLSHTPGPWEYATKLTASENHRGFFIRAEKQSRNGKWALAEVQPADEDGKTGKANARLIASAPELLEALDTLLNRIELEDCSLIHSPAFKAGRAAIAKATGAI